ncbi:ATP-binding cassette domain-containing protein, partial [Parabacteroides distasonis]
YTKNSGSIVIDGVPVEIHSTQDAQKLGISVIYQEFALVPELSITQNAFLGKEKRKGKFFLSVAEMAKETEKFMDRLNLKVNVGRKVRSLSVSQQQMVEIAKAMSADSWLV